MLYNIISENICLRVDVVKILAKPIEVISCIDTNGNVNPVRFKITNEDKINFVIKIDKVVCVNREKLDGNNMLI